MAEVGVDEVDVDELEVEEVDVVDVKLRDRKVVGKVNFFKLWLKSSCCCPPRSTVAKTASFWSRPHSPSSGTGGDVHVLEAVGRRRLSQCRVGDGVVDIDVPSFILLEV